VACAGVWDHYGWRAHVNGELRAGRVPWSHLRGDSGWQREKGDGGAAAGAGAVGGLNPRWLVVAFEVGS
jgi:hypothetical protein